MTDEVIEKVYDRDDWLCILCGKNELDRPHHAWFGLEARRTEDRNDPDQLVTLCITCHTSIHSHGNYVKREKCKEYLREYYGLSY